LRKRTPIGPLVPGRVSIVARERFIDDDLSALPPMAP